MKSWIIKKIRPYLQPLAEFDSSPSGFVDWLFNFEYPHTTNAVEISIVLANNISRAVYLLNPTLTLSVLFGSLLGSFVKTIAETSLPENHLLRNNAHWLEKFTHLASSVFFMGPSVISRHSSQQIIFNMSSALQPYSIVSTVVRIGATGVFTQLVLPPGSFISMLTVIGSILPTVGASTTPTDNADKTEAILARLKRRIFDINSLNAGIIHYLNEPDENNIIVLTIFLKKLPELVTNIKGLELSQAVNFIFEAAARMGRLDAIIILSENYKGLIAAESLRQAISTAGRYGHQEIINYLFNNKNPKIHTQTPQATPNKSNHFEEYLASALVVLNTFIFTLLAIYYSRHKITTQLQLNDTKKTEELKVNTSPKVIPKKISPKANKVMNDHKTEQTAKNKKYNRFKAVVENISSLCSDIIVTCEKDEKSDVNTIIISITSPNNSLTQVEILDFIYKTLIKSQINNVAKNDQNITITNFYENNYTNFEINIGKDINKKIQEKQRLAHEAQEKLIQERESNEQEARRTKKKQAEKEALARFELQRTKPQAHGSSAQPLTPGLTPNQKQQISEGRPAQIEEDAEDHASIAPTESPEDDEDETASTSTDTGSATSMNTTDSSSPPTSFSGTSLSPSKLPISLPPTRSSSPKTSLLLDVDSTSQYGPFSFFSSPLLPFQRRKSTGSDVQIPSDLTAFLAQHDFKHHDDAHYLQPQEVSLQLADVQNELQSLINQKATIETQLNLSQDMLDEKMARVKPGKNTQPPKRIIEYTKIHQEKRAQLLGLEAKIDAMKEIEEEIRDPKGTVIKIQQQIQLLAKQETALTDDMQKCLSNRAKTAEPSSSDKGIKDRSIPNIIAAHDEIYGEQRSQLLDLTSRISILKLRHEKINANISFHIKPNSVTLPDTTETDESPATSPRARIVADLENLMDDNDDAMIPHLAPG